MTENSMSETRNETHTVPTRRDSKPPERALMAQSEAQSRLRESGYREFQSVSCEYSGGVLTLRGRVPSFYLKQLAQTLIRGVRFVAEIHNRLEVAAAPGAEARSAAIRRLTP